MSKQVVQYRELQFNGLSHVGPWLSPVGQWVQVVPVDHPDTIGVLNGYWATTSQVVSYDETTGQFETQNTLYVPEGSLE
jgi:hypothetical protein